MKTECFITVQNKKYSYILSQHKNSENENVTHFVCKSASIDQDFLNEDIPALITDLPNLILAEEEFQSQQSAEIIRFRVSVSEKQSIKKNALRNGYKNVSSFIRDLALGA